MLSQKESFQFLEVAFAKSQGYLTLTAIHPDGQHQSPSRHISLDQPKLLEDALGALFACNQAGWGAYFSVASRKTDFGRWRRGGQRDLQELPALFVDVDLPANEALPRLEAHDPSPSAIIYSGLGLHAYWWLEQASQDWQAATNALATLQTALGADRSSIVSAMRLPMSINTKPQRQGALCRVHRLSEKRYPLAVFAKENLGKTSQTVQSFSANSFYKSSSQVEQFYPQRANQSKPNSQSRMLNPRLIQAICTCLEADYSGYWRRNGWLAARCPCPHHQDSAGQHFSFKPELGLAICLGKHGKMLLKDLCNVLELIPSHYGGLFV